MVPLYASAIVGADWRALVTERSLRDVCFRDLRRLVLHIRSSISTAEELRDLAARSPLGWERILIAAAYLEILRIADRPAHWEKNIHATLLRMDAVMLCRFGLLKAMVNWHEY